MVDDHLHTVKVCVDAIRPLDCLRQFLESDLQNHLRIPKYRGGMEACALVEWALQFTVGQAIPTVQLLAYSLEVEMWVFN